MPDINYFALAVSVSAGVAVSVVWYVILFGDLRQRLSGITDEEIERDIQKIGVLERNLLHTVGLIVGAFILSYFVVLDGATTFVEGMSVGFFVWVVGTIIFILGGILSRKSRRENVYVVAIDLSHWLVVLMVMAGILATF